MKKHINYFLGLSVISFSAHGKSIEQALSSSTREIQNIYEIAALPLSLVVVGCMFIFAKTREMAKTHIFFIGVGTFLVMNAFAVSGWIRALLH